MKIIKILFFQSLALALAFAGLNVYAADQSICNPGATIILHNNGTLRSCQLKDDYYDDENEVQCKSDYLVSFYENGNLESCVLAAEASIDENTCKEGGLIYFYINGQLKSCVKPY